MMLPLCRLYYVAMSIGNPPKPYFLDVDTGSDLTWLQCDAPCVSCSKVPFPCTSPLLIYPIRFASIDLILD
jgi:hypothetical protein